MEMRRATMKEIHWNTRNRGIESLRISIQGVMNSSKRAGQYFLNSYEIKQVRSSPLRASYPQPTSTNRKCQGSKGMKLSMMKTWETSTKEIAWFEIHQIDSEIPKFSQELLPTSNNYLQKSALVICYLHIAFTTELKYRNPVPSTFLANPPNLNIQCPAMSRCPSRPLRCRWRGSAWPFD